jgi:glycosyltransferase involved in cell wall biosynthesis
MSGFYRFKSVSSTTDYHFLSIYFIIVSYMFKIFIKLIFLSAIVLLISILWNLQGFVALYTPWNCSSPLHSDSPRILIVWKMGTGEREFLNRLKITAEKDGVELCVYQQRGTWYEKYVRSIIMNRIISVFQPNFALHFDGASIPTSGVPSYLLIFNGFDQFFDPQNDRADVKNFQGFFYCAKDHSPLKKYLEDAGLPFKGMRIYPTCQNELFSSPINLKNDPSLFYCGHGWDARRTSNFIQNVMLNLESHGLLSVYGRAKVWTYLKSAYKGFLPSDGRTFLHAMHDKGITLILHSSEHIENAAPSGRIFEAAAANTLIISDRHPFVQEYFGDNVLYLDETDDPIALSQQILDYIQWAKNNPELAEDLANACHNIFLENFTLEKQLETMIKFTNQTCN